jgi:hypothetical protein
MAIYGFKEVEDAFKEVGIKPPTKEEWEQATGVTSDES